MRLPQHLNQYDLKTSVETVLREQQQYKDGDWSWDAIDGDWSRMELWHLPEDHGPTVWTGVEIGLGR